MISYNIKIVMIILNMVNSIEFDAILGHEKQTDNFSFDFFFLFTHFTMAFIIRYWLCYWLDDEIDLEN